MRKEINPEDCNSSRAVAGRKDGKEKAPCAPRRRKPRRNSPFIVSSRDEEAAFTFTLGKGRKTPCNHLAIFRGIKGNFHNCVPREPACEGTHLLQKEKKKQKKAFCSSVMTMEGGGGGGQSTFRFF